LAASFVCRFCADIVEPLDVNLEAEVDLGRRPPRNPQFSAGTSIKIILISFAGTPIFRKVDHERLVERSLRVHRSPGKHHDFDTSVAVPVGNLIRLVREAESRKASLS
jgi:hypothetical protein